MYGNVLSNSQINAMRNSRLMTIRPYDPSRMKLAHYKLRAGHLGTPGKLEQSGLRHHVHAHDFRDGPFPFQPHQYMIVQIKETILIPEGIVGNFVPASSLVEQGFGLTAGKLDSDYGEADEQRILFGLVNFLDVENVFDPGNGIAHIYFVDFRGTERLQVRQSDKERQEFSDRHIQLDRIADDGPDYSGSNDPW